VWCFCRSLDIELALRIYRQQGDAAMVLGLEKVLHIEDSKLMAGKTTDFYGSGLSKQDRFAKTGSGQAFGRLLFKKTVFSCGTGHVAMILEDYSTAQEFFLASARPLTALEVRSQKP
jgi:hypothetical protein